MSHDSRRSAPAAPHVLVCGASFAGLSTAYWLHQLGYRVTIIESACSLRKGGTPVDIEQRALPIIVRMGLLEDIESKSLPPRQTEFKAPDGTTLCIQEADGAEDAEHGRRIEIERDDLLDILFKKIEGKVEIIFDDTITSLHDDGTSVLVTFATAPERVFSLVFGCDGNHSAVRRMHFGPEAQYSRFLGLYFSISIIDKLVVQANTTQIFSVPGRTVLLNSYEEKTDVVFCFHELQEIAYDYRDEEQQRRMVQDRFADLGWQVPALLEEVRHADHFYFDKMSQITMPSWSKGRVALVGDAAYCASPAAGMGGSLALVGAAAMADALRLYPHDFTAAFAHYHDGLAPLIEEVQAGAIEFGLDMFVLRTEAQLRARNEQLLGG